MGTKRFFALLMPGAQRWYDGVKRLDAKKQGRRAKNRFDLCLTGNGAARHLGLLRNNEGSFAKAALSSAKVVCWRLPINHLCERQQSSRKGGGVSFSNYPVSRGRGLAMTGSPHVGLPRTNGLVRGVRTPLRYTPKGGCATCERRHWLQATSGTQTIERTADYDYDDDNDNDPRTRTSTSAIAAIVPAGT